MTDQHQIPALQAGLGAQRQSVVLTDTGTKDNYSPGGAEAWRRADHIRVDPAGGNLIIRGLTPPSNPPEPDFVLEKTFQTISIAKSTQFLHNDSNSDAEARIILVDKNVASGVHAYTMGPTDQFFKAKYDLEQMRWRANAIMPPGFFGLNGDGLLTANPTGNVGLIVSTQKARFIGRSLGLEIEFKEQEPWQMLSAFFEENVVLAPAAAIEIDTQATTGGSFASRVHLAQVGHSVKILNAEEGQFGHIHILQDNAADKTITSWLDSTGSPWIWEGGVAPTTTLVANARDFVQWWNLPQSGQIVGRYYNDIK